MGHLTPDFPGVHRLPFSSPHGDLGGVLPGLVIECKAWRRIDLAVWMKQAKASAARIGESAVAAVVAKRINHKVGKAYVIMELDDWITLIRQLSRQLSHKPPMELDDWMALIRQPSEPGPAPDIKMKLDNPYRVDL